MISLNKFITFNHILRNCSSSKKLFASASILADKKDTKQVVDEKKKFEAKSESKSDYNNVNCILLIV